MTSFFLLYSCMWTEIAHGNMIFILHSLNNSISHMCFHFFTPIGTGSRCSFA